MCRIVNNPVIPKWSNPRDWWLFATSFFTQSAHKYSMQKDVIGQHTLGMISSSYTKATPVISSDPLIIFFYKTIPFYLDIAFQNPGHILWNNNHWSYHWKASFLAFPAKLFFWGNVCRQDAPPFPSQWPPSQQLSEDTGPPWALWLMFSWALQAMISPSKGKQDIS